MSVNFSTNREFVLHTCSILDRSIEIGVLKNPFNHEENQEVSNVNPYLTQAKNWKEWMQAVEVVSPTDVNAYALEILNRLKVKVHSPDQARETLFKHYYEELTDFLLPHPDVISLPGITDLKKDKLLNPAMAGSDEYEANKKIYDGFVKDFMDGVRATSDLKPEMVKTASKMSLWAEEMFTKISVALANHTIGFIALIPIGFVVYKVSLIVFPFILAKGTVIAAPCLAKLPLAAMHAITWIRDNPVKCVLFCWGGGRFAKSSPYEKIFEISSAIFAAVYIDVILNNAPIIALTATLRTIILINPIATNCYTYGNLSYKETLDFYNKYKTSKAIWLETATPNKMEMKE